MPRDKQLSQFSKLMKRFAQTMQEAIALANIPPWKAVFVDIRSAQDGSYRDAKMRAILDDGTWASVKTTNAMNEVEYLIFQAKDDVFSPPWYGLRIEIIPSGECSVDYNYDPLCCEDESFYAD